MRAKVTTSSAIEDRPQRMLAAGDYDGLVSPLIDLSDSSDNLLRREASASFERVDDVVMGGVSSSQMVPATQRPCLVWSGKCRVAGGGFTGARTRPFSAPLDLSQYEGLCLR
jgi:hypothetical protein